MDQDDEARGKARDLMTDLDGAAGVDFNRDRAHGAEELRDLLARYERLKDQGLPMRRAHKVLARERGYKATKTIEGLLRDARLLERILGAWEDYRDGVTFEGPPAF